MVVVRFGPKLDLRMVFMGEKKESGLVLTGPNWAEVQSAVWEDSGIRGCNDWHHQTHFRRGLGLVSRVGSETLGFKL